MTQEFTLDEIRRLVAIALPDTLYHEHGNVLLSEIDALTARLTVLAGALRNIGDASVALDPEPFRKFVQRTVTEALGAERA